MHICPKKLSDCERALALWQGNAFWERMGFVQRNDLSYRDLSVNEKNT